MDPATRSRIEALLGDRVVDARAAVGGYTPAERWVVRLARGGSAFAKIGTSDDTARALRRERAAYECLPGSLVPEVLGFAEDTDRPILALEDLSGDRWPPPWTGPRVESVCEAVASLHACGAPLRPHAEVHASRPSGWTQVERDPRPFLGLGLAGSPWLERSLPELVAHESRLRLDGEAPCHLDIRSDNLCLTGRGALLVDWNLACLSNADLDLGFWLPSLEFEGGPRPETILPDAPEVAAWVAGFFAARAGLPVLPHAPRVRDVQRSQLGPALAWAARALGLPPPD